MFSRKSIQVLACIALLYLCLHAFLPKLMGLELLNQTRLLLLSNLLFQIISLCIILPTLGKKFFGWNILELWASLDWMLKRYLSTMPLLALSFFFTVLVLNFFNIKPEPMPAVMLLFQEKEKLNIVLFVIEAAIMAPLFEELIFRGIIYAALRKKFSFWQAAVISAALFSALHNNALSLLPVTVLGLLFAYAYERQKNIVIPVALHSLHNLATLVVILALKPY